MTAKEYLSQAYRVDRMVTAKLQRVRELQDLAAKATSTLSHMPMSATPNPHRMEDTIAKLVDMKNEVQNDIDALVDLKLDIVTTIRRVENPAHRTLLELRYLCFMPWEAIAADMQYSKQHLFRLHGRALKEIVGFPKEESKKP